MMESLKKASCDSYSLAVRFCYDICEELEYHKRSRRYLTFDEYKIFETYYSGLNLNVKHIAHSEARLLVHIIKCVMSCPEHPRILDAGCGLGSHAIFFSLLGADVVGVDLSKERLRVANKRIEYYQQKYNTPLRVKFYLKNVLRSCELGKFDIVWSNQSISHIHPVQDFLHAAWRNLKNGGYLIICDSNGINPYIIFKAWLIHRERGLYKLVKDPYTHELITYAQERMLNPLSLKTLLSKSNYNTQLIEYHGFVPPKFNTKRLFNFIDKVLTSMPIVRLIGGSYIIVGRKFVGDAAPVHS